MRLTLSLDSAQRDTWHRGTSEVAGPDKEASGLLWGTSLRLAISSSLEAEVALPVAFMEARDGAETVTRTSIGDVPTVLTWNGRRGAWSLGISGGAYWPTGELGAEGLPITANFSTGTVDPTVGWHVVWPSWNGWRGHLSSTARLVLGEQDNGRRLGSSLTTSLGVNHAMGRRFTGQLVVTHFHRQEDSGPVMEDSGGDWVYLMPQVVASVFRRSDQAIQVMVGARIPVLQDVNGMQLVESPAVSVGVGYTRHR